MNQVGKEAPIRCGRFKRAVALILLTASAIADSGVAGSADTGSPLVATAAHVQVAASAQRLKARSLGRRRSAIVATSAPSLVEPFSGATTAPNLWSATGDACLTAGPAPTPSPTPSPAQTTSPIAATIPSCGANAPVDTPGSGVLQLTTAHQNEEGSVVYRTPFATANGLQVIFTDYAFGGSTPGGSGLSMFLADASQAFPVPAGVTPLGYIGLAGGDLGVGFDEDGSFSGYGGGPNVSETIALRGADALATPNPYLGGVVNATGSPAPLPFNLDQPAVTSRPANAPTMRVTILPTGETIVEVDIHDGNGFNVYLDKLTTGVNGQPALPAAVYLGFAAENGTDDNVHQLSGVSVSYLTPVSATTFSPTQIANLSGWYDASDPTTIAQSRGSVSTWLDKSGNGNTVSQSNAAAMPSIGANLDGLSTLRFAGAQFLATGNPLFSSSLFNESTVFVVTNQADVLQSSSVLSAGSIATTQPRYDLRLSDGGQTNFDFNNTGAGRLSASTQPNGPSLWVATGSVSAGSQVLRKNGLNIASSTGPLAATSGSYPMIVGANSASVRPAYGYNGSIGEILVFDSALSSGDMTTVEGYLACKWGLQTLLPANHAYKRTCPPGISPLGSIAPTTATGTPAGPLVEPAQLISANGLLTLNLVAKASDAAGDPELTYNGSPTAPTLRLLPGDVLTVNLTNALPAPPPGAGYLNDTNLHFHGLHVSPNAPSDDSIDLLALPGQSLQYKIAIPPNHPPGLYWYHSHAHGEAERQNLAGMSGALIIDGIASYVPAVANMRERVLIARDAAPPGTALPDADRKQLAAMFWAMQHANTKKARAGMTMGDSVQVRGRSSKTTRNPYVTVNPRYRSIARRRNDTSDGHCVAGSPETPVKHLTIDGQTEPAIGIAPGEQQFWRVVNAGSDTYLDVQLDNASLQVVSIDGVPISTGINTPSMVTVPDYVLPPASRVEFIVTGPPAGTPAYLRTNCFDAGASGAPMPAAILASIDPTATTAIVPQRPVQRIAPRAKPYRFARGLRRRDVVVARSQTLTYDDQNTIDGTAYDPAAPPMLYAQSGTYEEWTIVNNSAQVHTFHIHQVHFVLEAINGVTQPSEYVEDNVNVPAASSSGPGSVKILLDFTDPTIIGTFLLHCHILAHEDQGMMAKIRVGTAPPLGLGSSSLSFTTPSAAAQSVTISGGAAPYSVTGCSSYATGTVNSAETAVSVSPQAVGSCVLTVSDSSDQSATIAVTVNPAPPPITLSPTSVGFATTNAAAASVSISGGTAPYNVSGCSGVATGTVNAAETSVSIAPAMVGSCQLTVTDSTSPANSSTISVSVNGGASANAIDNVTFHHDAGRTGWSSSETTLTPANVGSSSFALLGSIGPSGMTSAMPAQNATFGKVYAQPLYASQEETSDGKLHNLVIVATSTDQIYAVDDATGAVAWHTSFTNGTVVQQNYNDTGCQDVNPDVGITGTPVIDRAADLLYVVVPTKDTSTSPATFSLTLNAVSLATGAIKMSTNVSATVALSSGGTATVNPEFNYNRAALLEANGNIYVGLGSHCDYDANTIHGWLLSYSASTLAQTGNVIDTTNTSSGNGNFLGAIWMSGFGPAADAQGNIYAATGNGPWDGVNDFGMSDLKLPGNLDITKVSYFTPAAESADNGSDEDLGAGGIMILPDLPGKYPHVAVQGGKCHVVPSGAPSGTLPVCDKYLLNRDLMGGQQSGDAGALLQTTLVETNGASGTWGGPASYQDAAGNAYLIYGATSLSSFKIVTSSSGAPTLSVVSTINSSVGCLECRNQGSQPIVSSNGTTAGTAVVWALKTPYNNGGNITLYAFDPTNMGTTLFSGTAGPWQPATNASYIAGALVSPLVANGKVYVPTDGSVAVFGLKP